VNIGLPYLVYTLMAARFGDFCALAASAAPPTAWNIYELIRFRKVDALAFVILAGIVLSMLAVLAGGSPRMLMVRENLFSIPIGLAFLVTAGAKRPLIYHLGSAVFARSDPENHPAMLRAFERPEVVRAMRVMSVVWGLGLAGQGALLGWMALSWPIPTYLLISPVIGYGTIIALGVWTYWYRTRLRDQSPHAETAHPPDTAKSPLHPPPTLPHT